MAKSRTLAEYAELAAAGSDGNGVRCPQCGCGHFIPSYKKAVAGGDARVKRCRNCGTRVQTVEAIKRILPPTGRETNSIYRIVSDEGLADVG